jgi:DcaP outer membrane protein
MRILKASTLPMTAAIVCAVASHAARAQEPTRSFEIYGFAMVDVIQDTKRVDPNWMDAFRPSKIATPEGEFGTNGQSSISVKQSRVGVKGSMPTGDSTAPIDFKFEIDMFGTGVDAGQTTIRLRHVYGEWGSVLGGQTNTVFMDGDIFPNTIDYWGPNGMVFVRVPQLRWTPYRTTTDEFAVSLEHAGNDVDPGNIRLVEQFQNATVNGTRTVPDLAAHYKSTQSWGHFQIAGILRKISYEYQPDPATPLAKDHQTGWGVNLSGHINMLEKDKILLGVVHGNGIATYMNDGGMDIAPNAAYTPEVNPLAAPPKLSAEAVPLTGITAYYDHYWSPMYSSSIGYSQVQVTNTNFQSTTTFHRGEYASANLLAYPAKGVMIGLEVLYGKRIDNQGLSGDDVRFQLSAKYDFGVKL